MPYTLVDRPCDLCGDHDWRINAATTISGSTVHPYYCGNCLRHTQAYVKKSLARRLGCDHIIHLVRQEEKRVCEVCGAVGAERHHWAPGYLFGPESDRWPTSLLCVPCHRR